MASALNLFDAVARRSSGRAAKKMIHKSFPEIVAMGALLPDGTVLDGEILAWQGDKPAPFAQLQRRLGRKEVGKKLLSEVPCVLLAFDLIEHGGRDLRSTPLSARRELLESLPGVLVSQKVTGGDWMRSTASGKRLGRSRRRA